MSRLFFIIIQEFYELAEGFRLVSGFTNFLYLTRYLEVSYLRWFYGQEPTQLGYLTALGFLESKEILGVLSI